MDKQKIRLLLKLMELKEEWDNNPQSNGVDWKRQLIKAARGEVDEAKQKQLDQLEQTLDMLEFFKAMNNENTAQ